MNATQLVQEIVEKAREVRKNSSKGKLKCSIPYAVNQAMEEYDFESSAVKKELRSAACSTFGKTGSKITNSIKKSKAKKKVRNEKHYSLFISPPSKN